MYVWQMEHTCTSLSPQNVTKVAVKSFLKCESAEMKGLVQETTGNKRSRLISRAGGEAKGSFTEGL